MYEIKEYKINIKLISIVHITQFCCQLTFLDIVKDKGTCLAHAIVCISLSLLAPCYVYLLAVILCSPPRYEIL